jgi:chemotaxis protein methyltransferase CheR
MKLDQPIKMLEEKLGALFGTKEDFKIQDKLVLVQKQLGYSSLEICVKELLEKQISAKTLYSIAHIFTIGETYFFRSQATYHLLEKKIIPERVSKQGPIKVWSCGCSSGEEAYSVAILLDRLRAFGSTVVGTDINQKGLEKGRLGLYSPWSFRGVSKKIQETYFEQKSENLWEIKDEIKKYVQFYPFNIFSDEMNNSFDLILCNNVLIYFKKEAIEKAVSLFVEKLNPNGILIVSSVEIPYISHPNLYSIAENGVTFFVKGAKPAPKKTKEKSLPVFSFVEIPSKVAVEKKDGHNAWVHSLRHLLQKGHLDQVVQEIEKTVPEKSLLELTEPLSLLIEAQIGLKQHEKAKKICEKALTVNALNPYFYFLYGVVLEEMDLKHEAITAFKKSLFLEPQFVMASFYLGVVYQSERDFDKADLYLQNALSVVKQYPPRSFLPGSCEMTREHLIDVIENLKEKMP